MSKGAQEPVQQQQQVLELSDAVMRVVRGEDQAPAPPLPSNTMHPLGMYLCMDAVPASWNAPINLANFENEYVSRTTI
jgi:hypothetical protein